MAAPVADRARTAQRLFVYNLWTMTFRIRQSHDGLVRSITVSLLTFPGVRIPRGNEQNPPPHEKDVPLGLSDTDLDAATGIIGRQARAWTGFELQLPNRSRIRYEISFRIAVAENKGRVCYVADNGGSVNVDDFRTCPGARSHIEILREARARGFDNMAVIHPSFSFDPHGEYVRPDGVLPCFQSRGERMERTCNLIPLSHEQLSSSANNQTATHEIGHLLGLGHRRANGVHDAGNYLMISQESLLRSFHRSDQVNLHRVTERLGRRAGVLWEGTRTPHPYPG